MKLRHIQHDSPDYRQMIDLRLTTLLQPIGIPAHYINQEAEGSDLLLAAFEGEAMIGCCVLTRLDDTTVQLRQMAVRDDQQGKGVGALLLDFAEETAREHGYSLMMMHARNPVIGFYEKSGYAIEGDEFFEVGMGHHRMEKKLRE